MNLCSFSTTQFLVVVLYQYFYLEFLNEVIVNNLKFLK